MITREIISAMLRRWYIPLGLLACAVLVTLMMARDGGIYTTSTVVSFMRPDSTTLSPENGTDDSSVIAFSGSVVVQTNSGRPAAGYSMQDAPYYGAGIREGWLVELSDSGNQWASSFSKAEIEIQVVGRTFDWVKAKQQELVGTVLHVAESQQAAVSPGSRISASVVPLTTQIEYVAPSRSSQLSAAAAMLAAAIIIGAWASIAADRLLSKRRSVAGTPRSRAPDRVLDGSLS